MKTNNNETEIISSKLAMGLSQQYRKIRFEAIRFRKTCLSRYPINERKPKNIITNTVWALQRQQALQSSEISFKPTIFCKLIFPAKNQCVPHYLLGKYTHRSMELGKLLNWNFFFHFEFMYSFPQLIVTKSANTEIRLTLEKGTSFNQQCEKIT